MSPDANGDATRADIKRSILVLEQLPELIVAHRAKRGHGVRAAAESIGVTAAALSEMERGLRQPVLPTTLAILHYLARNR